MTGGESWIWLQSGPRMCNSPLFGVPIPASQRSAFPPHFKAGPFSPGLVLLVLLFPAIVSPEKVVVVTNGDGSSFHGSHPPVANETIDGELVFILDPPICLDGRSSALVPLLQKDDLRRERIMTQPFAPRRGREPAKCTLHFTSARSAHGGL